MDKVRRSNERKAMAVYGLKLARELFDRKPSWGNQAKLQLAEKRFELAHETEIQEKINGATY